mmetsp:Transcript_101/g.293  ORF Transcript_101/g.293 Transcript_101/m.293 type:complete len:208 (-) Transcript_101:367-990(-)
MYVHVTAGEFCLVQQCTQRACGPQQSRPKSVLVEVHNGEPVEGHVALPVQVAYGGQVDVSNEELLVRLQAENCRYASLPQRFHVLETLRVRTHDEPVPYGVKLDVVSEGAIIPLYCTVGVRAVRASVGVPLPPHTSVAVAVEHVPVREPSPLNGRQHDRPAPVLKLSHGHRMFPLSQLRRRSDDHHFTLVLDVFGHAYFKYNGWKPG